MNFVQSHLALLYSSSEFFVIRQWSQACNERYAPFKAAEAQFPEFGNMDSVQKTAKEHLNRLAAESALKVEEMKKKAAAAAQALRMEALAKKNVTTSSKKKSLEDMKPNSTIPRTTKWKSTSDLNTDATRNTDSDSANLSDTVRPPGLEREANPVVAFKPKSSLGYSLDDSSAFSALSDVLSKLEIDQKAGKTVREE
jgi:hypothetical protein